MAYKIYQQLESGMGMYALTESTEVGYTKNAEINATRFDGATVAGALDDINNILSSPHDLPKPVIKMTYTITKHNQDPITHTIFSNDPLYQPIELEMGDMINYTSQYKWALKNGQTIPTKVLEGSWNELTEDGIYSDEISEIITNSKKIFISLGADRNGLTIQNNIITPAVITDSISSEIDIIYKKRIYNGILNMADEINYDNILKLNSDLIDQLEYNKIDREVTLNDDELYIFTYPASLGKLDIIYNFENQNMFWFKTQKDITTAAGYCESYNIYYCSPGAYKNQFVSFIIKL